MMKLNKLFKLSPLAYEEVRRETIRQRGIEYWHQMVIKNAPIGGCFDYYETNNIAMWLQLDFEGDTTLLKEWEATQ